MQKPKKYGSIRKRVLLTLACSLGAFALIVFSILYWTMPQMLLQTETRYLTEQIDITKGLLGDAIENTYWMADDIGIWEETVRFAKGENPQYLANNWPESSLLETYSFDFILIKDDAGQDLYAEYYDHIGGTHFAEPEGFSAYVNENLAERVLDMYRHGAHMADTIEELGQGGIFFYGGKQYFGATMPILPARETGDAPVGTVTLGNVLSNEYFREMTHYADVQFAVEPGGDGQAGAQINRLGDNLVHSSIYMEDIHGNPVQLRMQDARQVYKQGSADINLAALLVVAAILLFGAVLYRLIRKMLLRPVEQLSRDLQKMGKEDRLRPEAYSGSREFLALCGSINETLGRLTESDNALRILDHILEGVDANIYVADPDTDEILYMNAHMKADFPEKAPIGERCYTALHARDARCEGCPIHQLQTEPEAVLEWESYNAQTGKYLKNTDLLIDWFDGKKVRLEHSVDITESRRTADSLRRRLEQQALVASVTQNFLSTADIEKPIHEALRMTGEFMRVSKIVIATANKEKDCIHFTYGWHSGQEETQELQVHEAPFLPGSELYDSFVVERKPYIAWEDLSNADNFRFMSDFGVRAFISVPILVAGSFWGIISVDECAGERQWSPSDIQLVRTISGLVSSAIARDEAEKDLIRMSSLVDMSPQFINYISNEGEFVYCNPGARALLGYTEEEMLGSFISLILDEDTFRYVSGQIIPEIIRQGKLSFQLPITRKDGEVRLMQFSAFRVDLEPAGIGSIAMDITEQKRLEQELIAAKELAESSSHAKSDFLSRMSHEMRTPMSAIIGMTNIAKNSDDPEKKEYCLDKIQDASNHLLGVINDILDMSKIEAKKFELSYTEFNFEKMLMRVVDVINFRVEEKKQNLIVKLDPDIPQYVVCDEQRIAQVITNFLSNAVKFTPEHGDITLRVTKREEDGELCVIEVEVTDTGIGISREEQRRLFRSFEQADGGIARRFGGTGLGLAISKSIIDLMGGQIGVRSESGMGATFWFTVSMQRGESAPQRCLAEGINWGNLRILVVDDSPDVLEYFQSIARSIGLYCEVAAGGEEAIRRIEENADTPFNIVFVDWKMPGMNGVELTQKIKSELKLDIVVIMISVAEWSEIEQQARQAGVDRFVAKPLFPSLIVDCINECLGIARQEEDIAAITVEDVEQFAGRHILLAEDIDINREIVISLLEGTGLEIHSAENGKRAVEMFRAAPELYDMIFMDIHMPEMDGYEATRRIRALDLPEARRVPIIAMTANVFREDVERCLEAGMNSHIGKPINIEDMFKKMRRYMPRD